MLHLAIAHTVVTLLELTDSVFSHWINVTNVHANAGEIGVSVQPAGEEFFRTIALTGTGATKVTADLLSAIASVLR